MASAVTIFWCVISIGGMTMPLRELAEGSRVVGANAVLRKLKANMTKKIFISDDADKAVTDEIVRIASDMHVPVERVENSKQLGRACALEIKTAAAALLKN